MGLDKSEEFDKDSFAGGLLMALVVTREDFVGKYDGVTPAILLPSGSVSNGLNMRKICKTGGWKPRKGCVIANTTAAEGGTAVKSLHQYKHPYILMRPPGPSTCPL